MCSTSPTSFPSFGSLSAVHPEHPSCSTAIRLVSVKAKRTWRRIRATPRHEPHHSNLQGATVVGLAVHKRHLTNWHLLGYRRLSELNKWRQRCRRACRSSGFVSGRISAPPRPRLVLTKNLPWLSADSQ